MMTACATAFLAMRLVATGLTGVDKNAPLPLPQAKTTAVAKNVAAPKPGTEDTVCTLQVVDGDLSTMLRTLSERTRISLVLLSPSDTKITVNLVQTRFIDALGHLCAMSGLSYLKVGNTYVVATKEKLKEAYRDAYFSVHPDEVPKPAPPADPPAEIVTEIYLSNYVSSAQLATAIGALFPKEKLAVVAGPVQANPNVSSQSTTTTTGVEANVLQHDGATDAASGKMLVLKGEKETVAQALDLVRKMDSMRPQVAIEVTIHDISDAALRELGISWSFGNVSLKEETPHGVNFGSFARAPMSFTGVIKALEQQDKAKLLASPNISVLDGERAFILIGDRINYPVLVGYSQNNAPIFSKEEERVGIYMQVAASVSSDDNITLSLYPQVSNVTGFLQVNGASYPQISTREAQTTVRIHSGETLVMGGLLKSEETSTYEKVPLLSQLPFLGELFKRRRTNHNASQVIISITPKVIRTDESR